MKPALLVCPLSGEPDGHFALAYNGLGTRVSKTDSAGTTSYKRAGAYVTDSLLKSTVSSTTTDYSPGVSSRVGSDSTFLHSGLKNADTQTDHGGDVSAMRRYDAFGTPLAAWGGWQGPFGYGGPYGYQTDPDHGLMLLGHRYYESDTGRFLTRDPIKDGWNWYGYCDGNPVGFADPDGLQRLLIIQKPGGIGMGSHLVIGLEDVQGRRTFCGFYPSLDSSGEGKPEESGKKKSGSSRSSTGSSSKGKGPGWVRAGDQTGPGAVIAEVPITEEVRLRIRLEIMTSQMQYLRGKGLRYDVEDFNCAHWAVMILELAMTGKEWPDWRNHRFLTPKAVRETPDTWPD